MCAMPEWIRFFSFRVVFIGAFLFSVFLQADSSTLPQNASDLEESLALRRIADFWQEGDYSMAKHEIETYLAGHPHTPSQERLAGFLGEIYLKEKNYKKALDAYACIQTEEALEKILLQKMLCLFELHWFPALKEECKAALQNAKLASYTKELTYYLASAFYAEVQEAKTPSKEVLQEALGYFETLTKEETSFDLWMAKAHLYSLSRDFSKAAETYQWIANQDPEKKEEILFQAALMQAKQDPSSGIPLFEELEKYPGKKTAAAYNRMLLLFEAKRFEELVSLKEHWIQQLGSEQIPLVHLFVGRSSLERQDYGLASHELQTALSKAPNISWAPFAYTLLAKTHFALQNLEGLSKTCKAFEERFPSHKELASLLFTKALLLKKQGELSLARKALQEILDQCGTASIRPQALFEATHLAYQAKDFSLSLEYAFLFLEEFPSHDLAHFALHYFGNSCSQVDLSQNPVLEKIACLEKVQNPEWEFVLAKAYFDLNQQEKAEKILKPLLNKEVCFSKKSDVLLLYALCLAGQGKEIPQALAFVEKALQEEVSVLDPTQQQVLLFNLSLQAEQPEKGARHLLTAFQRGAFLQEENLLWLAQFLEEKDPENAIPLYEKLLEKNKKEERAFALAHLYIKTTQEEKATLLLEETLAKVSQPSDEGLYLLASAYLPSSLDRAKALFQQLYESYPPMQSFWSAQGALELAKQHLALAKRPFVSEDPPLQEALSILKNLWVQKNLNYEPVHLEALYLYLQVKQELLQKLPKEYLALLEKVELELEEKEGVLSREYHELLSQTPEKQAVYQQYLDWIQAESYFIRGKIAADSSVEKMWTEKGQQILEKIKKEPLSSPLQTRIAGQFSDGSQ